MAFYIEEVCIRCDVCIPQCPTGAISGKAARPGGDIYLIDPEKCTVCVGFHATPRCAEVCPVGAPKADPKHPENREQLLAKFQRLYPDKTPVAT